MAYTYLCEKAKKKKNTTHMHRVPHTVTLGAVRRHIGEPLNTDDMFLTPHKLLLLQCTQLFLPELASLTLSGVAVRVHLEGVLQRNIFSSSAYTHISPVTLAFANR